jgi:hypothetical protein
MVVYFDNGKVTHAAALGDKGALRSKWGGNEVHAHGLWDARFVRKCCAILPQARFRSCLPPVGHDARIALMHGYATSEFVCAKSSTMRVAGDRGRTHRKQ